MKMIEATKRVCDVLKDRGMSEGTLVQYAALLEQFAPTAENVEDLTREDVDGFMVGSYVTTRKNGELRRDVDRKRLEHIVLNSVDVMAEEGMLTFEWNRDKPRRGRKAGSKNKPKAETVTTPTEEATETQMEEPQDDTQDTEPTATEETECTETAEDGKEVAHFSFNTLFPRGSQEGQTV